MKCSWLVKRVSILVCFLLIFILCGCNKKNGTVWFVEDYAPNETYEANLGDMFLDSKTYDIYQMIESGWEKVGNIGGIGGVDGVDGITPSIEINNDGYWVINGNTTKVKAVGEPGEKGKTYSIEINSDGYWMIDGKKTTIKAKGEDGKTPTIEVTDGNWYVNGIDTGIKAQAVDGKTPTVEIKNGNWYVNDEDTGVKAQGEDGVTPTINISNDGYWMIDGKKTTIKAQGEDGKTPTIEISDGKWYIDGEDTGIKAKGEDGITPIIKIIDGNWYINDADTGVKAQGEDGKTPTIEIKDENWYVNGVDTGVKAQGKDGKNSTVEIKNNFWYINGENSGLRVSDYVCKRASKLHTETCTSGAACTNKYSVNSIIEYGNLGSVNNLVSGDAFDCDVNGDGIFDSETERFYYMSDYYDTEKKTFNTNIAVLVYYSNVAFGSNSLDYAVGYAYPNNTTNEGPVNAAKHMPEIGNWSNVYLINSNRQIVNEKGIAQVSTVATSKYNYSGYAARLLTTQEIEKACGITVGNCTKNELLSCEYLLESTAYGNLNGRLAGYILETPRSTYVGTTPVIHAVFAGQDPSVVNSVYNGIGAKYVSYYGVRPVIEVSKSRIAY